MKINDILAITLFILIILNISAFYLIVTDVDDISSNIKTIERSEMCNGLIQEDYFLNGFYKQNKYYCVWIKDRTELDINRTDIHENCHHLIYNDYNHFCNNTTNK